MDMKQPQKWKIMIILWHWEELNKKETFYDTIDIDGDDWCKIVRVDDSVLDEEKKSEILKQIADWSAQASEILLMLHATSATPEYYTQLETDCKSKKLNNSTIKISYFGGGKSYIYYKAQSDSGFLNAPTDNFTINRYYDWTDPTTGEYHQKKTTVINPDNNKLYKKYFDSVWNYYTYEIKRITFELKENLFIYLVGQLSNNDKNNNHALWNLLEAEKYWLHERLAYFCNTELHETRIYDIYNNKGTVEYYKSVVQFIRDEPVNSNGYLQELRTKFADLLQAMPELIYV